MFNHRMHLKRSRHLVLPLLGGFGNQLFTFAAALNFCNRLDVDAQLDPSFQILAEVNGATRRNVEIDDLRAARISITDRSAIRALGFFARRAVRPKTWILESTTTDWKAVEFHQSLRVVYGYFQDRELVDPVMPLVVQAIRESRSFSSLLDGTASDEIALHVRGGDKLLDSQISYFGKTSTDFYVRGVASVARKTGFKRIAIYSDDPNVASLVMNKLQDHNPEYHVENKSNLDYLSDFKAILWSRAIVMSCSSFSWWAARLGGYLHDPVVVVPHPWQSSDLSVDRRLNDDTWIPVTKYGHG